jgi:hypothetical protein
MTVALQVRQGIGQRGSSPGLAPADFAKGLRPVAKAVPGTRLRTRGLLLCRPRCSRVHIQSCSGAQPDQLVLLVLLVQRRA